MDQTAPFDRAADQFDRASISEHLQAADWERAEVLRRFPLDRWPSLKLEEYALGQDGSEDTFSRWLEFRTLHVGSMRGGSARKLLIYKHRNKPGWYFDPRFQNEQEAWRAIRDGFLKAFELARAGDWDLIDDIPAIRNGSSLRAKALHIYFPQDVLPITSRQHLAHFLRSLGRPEADDISDDVIRLNRALLAAVRAHPQCAEWTTKEIERFLYGWADPRSSRQVVKIAPGEGAKFWRECLDGGYICVGWDEVGDLTAFESKEAFEERFLELYLAQYRQESFAKKKAAELWTLVELEPGDVVVANKGKSHVLAVGKVVAPGYGWRPERSEYKHVVRVKWDESYAQSISEQKRWAFATVAKVSSSLFAEILKRGRGPDTPPPVPPVLTVPPYAEIASAIERKGQVILYGPPGTGKTYVARRLAVAWLLQQNGERASLATQEDFDGAYRQLQSVGGAVGQLTALTFHASYSYEDFIEGFRPVQEEGGRLGLRLEDGIFKRICREAAAHPRRPYLVIIDEINRANVAKVLGELITLLEKDKRGTVVTLPQSKEAFTIPPNVFIVATMNTADKSIKLIDAALRRRFAFLELMPDTDLLHGVSIGGLALDAFLEELNRRVSSREGREKQIGHSYLLDGEQPVATPEEFARRFRHEILPLLQEYCYDEYGTLAEYLGQGIIDVDAQRLREEVLADPDRLIDVLQREFGTAHFESGS